MRGRGRLGRVGIVKLVTRVELGTDGGRGEVCWALACITLRLPG